jgi:hypothetical protein
MLVWMFGWRFIMTKEYLIIPVPKFNLKSQVLSNVGKPCWRNLRETCLTYNCQRNYSQGLPSPRCTMSRKLINYFMYWAKYICYKLPTFFVVCTGVIYLRVSLLSHRFLLHLIKCLALKCRCRCGTSIYTNIFLNI